jgi:hypothetical protein
MSRNSWRVTAFLVIAGFAAYSFTVILLGLSDENNVSGLRGQGQTLFVVWTVLIAGGLLYFARGQRSPSLRRILRSRRGPSSRARSTTFDSIRPLYTTPASSYATGVRRCSGCSRTFKTSIDLADMGRTTRVMYCDGCGYTVCERCNASAWDEFRITPCPGCGQRLWKLEGMLPS